MEIGSLDAHLLYSLAWLSFGAGHSLLASETIKRRLRPFFGAFYRIAYNAFATVHLGLVWLLGSWAFQDGIPFDPHAGVKFPLVAAHLLGWLVLIAGLLGYDLGRLAGARQIRSYRAGAREPEDEPLRLDGLHRYVRHPLYSGAFLILWGRVDGPFELATAIWGSLYLLAGTWLEERRLLKLYGWQYADYRHATPAYIPWKGRVR